MIPRVKSVIPMENYILDVVFDDNVRVHYDMKEIFKVYIKMFS